MAEQTGAEKTLAAVAAAAEESPNATPAPPLRPGIGTTIGGRMAHESDTPAIDHIASFAHWANAVDRRRL